MSEFESALRDKVTEAERTLTEARQAGHDYEVHLHGARLRDLLDLAARHGIDTERWIDPAVLGTEGHQVLELPHYRPKPMGARQR